ncbi:MAG: hypothetical protein RJS97_01505 [Parvibaculaceae bacterium]
MSRLLQEMPKPTLPIIPGAAAGAALAWTLAGQHAYEMGLMKRDPNAAEYRHQRKVRFGRYGPARNFERECIGQTPSHPPVP